MGWGRKRKAGGERMWALVPDRFEFGCYEVAIGAV